MNEDTKISHNLIYLQTLWIKKVCDVANSVSVSLFTCRCPLLSDWPPKVTSRRGRYPDVWNINQNKPVLNSTGGTCLPLGSRAVWWSRATRGFWDNKLVSSEKAQHLFSEVNALCFCTLRSSKWLRTYILNDILDKTPQNPHLHVNCSTLGYLLSWKTYKFVLVNDQFGYHLTITTFRYSGIYQGTRNVTCLQWVTNNKVQLENYGGLNVTQLNK